MQAPIIYESTLPSQWPGALQRLDCCPVCTGTHRELELNQLSDVTFGVAPGVWTLWRCGDCGVFYLDPRPDEDSIQLAYADYYTHMPSAEPQPKDRTAWWRSAIGNSYRNWAFGTNRRPALPLGYLIAMLSPHHAHRIGRERRGLDRVQSGLHRLLDVGCGNGEFLQLARQLGWRGYGIDSDPVARVLAREHGVILGSRIQELGESYNGVFDAVTLSHVIEHVHQPSDVLSHCYRVLRPGGYLWLETPNGKSVGYAVYGRYWRGLECPRHLVLFNRGALHACLEKAGFVDIKIRSTNDVTAPMFYRSELARSGDVAERPTRQLSSEAVLKLRAAIRDARGIVRADPGRSEFLCIVGVRPPG